MKCNSNICKLVFHFSLWFKFSSAWFYLLWKYRKEREKIYPGKILIYIDSYSNMLHFVDVTLSNLIGGWGQYQFLGKISTHFPYFHLLTPSLKWSNHEFYIFHLPLFIITPPPCPPNPLLINYIFSWKCKLFLEASYGTNQTSKLEIFRKTVNGL